MEEAYEKKADIIGKRHLSRFDRTVKVLWLSALVSILFISLGSARQWDENIAIHGFVSQGYLQSDDNNYLTNSEDGSAEFAEAAINVSTELIDHFKLGLQFVARDLGPEGNNDVILDWAYGDYRWRDYLGTRIGKIKITAGLYNVGRDIDVLRTQILLPQSVYMEASRDYSMATQGMNVYGNLPLSTVGDIDYELTVGTVNMSDPNSGPTAILFQNIGNGIAAAMPPIIESEYGLPPGSVIVDFSDITNEMISLHLAYGANLTWTTPIPGLRLGGTYFTLSLDASSTDKFTITTPPVPPFPAMTTEETVEINAQSNLEKYMVLSGEYQWRNLQLAVEYSEIDITTDVDIPDLPTTSFKNTIGGYYGLVGYRLYDFFAVSTYYSEFFTDRTDKDGSDLVSNGLIQRDYYSWQKDLCVSTRFDINKNWLLKFELHRMNGAAMLNTGLNDSNLKEDWLLFAIKNTFHF